MMAWRRRGDKPLSEPMMVSLLTHICVTRPQWVKDRTSMAMDSSCTTLKMKCCHFDEIFIIGCNVSCWNDNFLCNQWHKFYKNDDISISVKETIISKFIREGKCIRWSWLQIQCGVITTQSIFPHIHTTDSSPMRVRYGVSFVSSMSDYSPYTNM